MPGGWAGSTRSARLPSNWYTEIVPAVKARDGDVCYLCGDRGADTVDHKSPGDDHRLENLGMVHDRNWPHCHRYKSSAEGNAARRRYSTKRKPERHPGLR